MAQQLKEAGVQVACYLGIAALIRAVAGGEAVPSQVVWVASGWKGVVLSSFHRCVIIDRGRLGFWTDRLPDNLSDPVWTWGTSQQFTLDWWFGAPLSVAGFYIFPLWFPAALCMLATFAAWRLDAIARRRGTGKCAKCGYDRAGIAAAAPCPECGSPRSPACPVR